MDRHSSKKKVTTAQVRSLMDAAAKRYDIPKVYITAHVRFPRADQARRDVWRTLVYEWGMKRGRVAAMFGRDLRRLRASVIGPASVSR
jgi:hypothetical protein